MIKLWNVWMLGPRKGEISLFVSLLAVRRFNFISQNRKRIANLCREKKIAQKLLQLQSSSTQNPRNAYIMEWPPSSSLAPKTNRFELISKEVTCRRPWEMVQRAEHLNLLNKSHFVELRKRTSGRLLKFIRFFCLQSARTRKLAWDINISVSRGSREISRLRRWIQLSDLLSLRKAISNGDLNVYHCTSQKMRGSRCHLRSVGGLSDVN